MIFPKPHLFRELSLRGLVNQVTDPELEKS